MKAGDYRYTVGAETYRVVIAGDVIALPDEEWAMGGFGPRISTEWLLHSGRLPVISQRERRVLARVIRRALADHHGYPFEEG